MTDLLHRLETFKRATEQDLAEAGPVHHLLPTSTSTEEAHRNARVAVLPIGSFEQHGSYLPLITDTVIAMTIAGELARRIRCLIATRDHLLLTRT